MNAEQVSEQINKRLDDHEHHCNTRHQQIEARLVRLETKMNGIMWGLGAIGATLLSIAAKVFGA